MRAPASPCPLPQAACPWNKAIAENVPGMVVEAELEKKTVTEVHIDAATGAVIDTEANVKKNGKKKKET